MCRRFIPIDCDEVARIAAEIERDLAAHADELASLDPIEAYEDFLFFPESAQPDRACAALAVRRRIGRAGRSPRNRRDRPREPPRGASLVGRAAHRGRGRRMRPRGSPYGLGIRGSLEERTRVQHAHRDGSAQRGQHVGRVLRASSLPGACSGLLRIACDRDGAERAHRAPREAPVRLSLVTTEPNAAVAPVHNRMPLALEPGEAALWLRGVYEPLLDRGAVRLTARPER